jgi:hypothetical protein
MLPAATNPNVSSVVATGRRINGLDRLISELDPRAPYTPQRDTFNAGVSRPGLPVSGKLAHKPAIQTHGQAGFACRYLPRLDLPFLDLPHLDLSCLGCHGWRQRSCQSRLIVAAAKRIDGSCAKMANSNQAAAKFKIEAIRRRPVAGCV